MGREPTPEEAEMYKKVVAAAMDILYSDGTHEKVMAMLQKGAKDPARAVAEAAKVILMQLREKAGGQITPEIMAGAAQEVVALIAELGVEAKLFQFTPELAQAAMQQVMSTVGPQQGPSPEEAPADPQQAPAGAQPQQGPGIVAGAMGGV